MRRNNALMLVSTIVWYLVRFLGITLDSNFRVELKTNKNESDVSFQHLVSSMVFFEEYV